MTTLTQVLASLASFIFYASLKTTVLVALILLAQKLLGRFLSANGRYLLWLTVVISLVTPIGFDTTLPAFVTPANGFAPITQPINETTGRLVAATPGTGVTGSALNPDSSPPATYGADAASAPSIPWGALMPWLWLTGALLVLGLVAIASYRFSVLVQRAQPVAEDLQKLLHGCLEQTACKVRVRLLQSADIQVPMIAGLFNPALLLPDGIEMRLTREQLRHVFIHELMHLQRRDIASNWLVVLVQALHWFNPAIWVAFSFMRQDCELACDAASLRHLDANGRRAYGYTLLQLSETLPRKPIPADALGIVESAAHLRERILMLASRSGRFQSTVATLLFLPLTAVAFSQPAPATAVQPVETAAPIEVVAAPAAQTVEEPQVTLEITIDAQGQYFINLGEEPAENPPPVPVEQIGEQVAKIMSANPEVPVFVVADAAIEYGIVIKLISTLQEAGVTEPRLLTQPPRLPAIQQRPVNEVRPVTLQRQVVLEAKILEVTLDEGFQSGIDASLLAIASNFDGVIRQLEAQGNVMVISSPRITTLNNQKAVFKVGDVSTDQSTVTTTGGNSTVENTNVSLQPLFSGIALDVTPQISENGDIILHIHPLLNSVEADLKTSGGEIPTLPKSDTRESDSIARARNGEVIVMSGLMQTRARGAEAGIPGEKTELVILLRAIVDEGSNMQDLIQD